MERQSEEPHDMQNPATEAVVALLDEVNTPTAADTTGFQCMKGDSSRHRARSELPPRVHPRRWKVLQVSHGSS